MLTDLPLPIQNDILKGVCFAPRRNPFSVNVGVKELLFCLRQSWLRRVCTKPITSLAVALRIYNGVIYDERFSRCFSKNQIYVNYQCRGSPAWINGRYDFYDNEVLTELKIVDDVSEVTKAGHANVMQLKFYAYCEKQTVAQLIYFDGCDAKRFPVDASASSGLMCFLECNAAVYYDCLVKRKLPAKTLFKKMCLNCEFKEGC
jgi:hypothetical protein